MREGEPFACRHSVAEHLAVLAQHPAALSQWWARHLADQLLQRVTVVRLDPRHGVERVAVGVRDERTTRQLQRLALRRRVSQIDEPRHLLGEFVTGDGL